MALTVVVRSGDLKSQATITFDAPRIVIGRGDGCEIRLPDPSVSHRHASIRQRGTDYVVIDEGSSNGTFVGPVRLSPQAPRVVRSGLTTPAWASSTGSTSGGRHPARSGGVA